jgi:hypothetical protein
MTRITKQERIARFYRSLGEIGVNYTDIDRLRRIEMTLHRWSERECGDSNDYASYMIERDEETEKPYSVVIHHGNGHTTRTPIADKEKGALKRLEQIMRSYPSLVAYHQSDPRGCALWLVPKEKLADDVSIDSVYTRGVAVCID